MNWEISILQKLQALRTPFITTLMETITMMSETFFIVMIIAVLYWCVNKKKSIRMGWIILLSSTVNASLKMMIRTRRPFELGIVSPLRAKTATGYSFPSGHTQAATSFWGAAILILKNRPTFILGGILIGLTALSRLYLGVHWPIDTLGGVCAGVVSVVVGNSLLKEEEGITAKHLLAVSVFLLICMILPVGISIGESAASLWAFVVGIYLEQKYINFKEQAIFKVQLYKLLIGLGGLVMMTLALKNVLPEERFLNMIQDILRILWLTAGAPYCFKKLLEVK